MLSGALLAVVMSSPAGLGGGQQAQPIGDSIRRAVAETEKFYGRQWQLEADALRVGLIEPGSKLRFNFSTSKETVTWTYAGKNNGSKLELNVMDAATKKVVEKMDQDSLGSLYFMPKRSKTYTVEITNVGDEEDFISVVQATGGLGAALPLSKLRFLASSSGHALWEQAAAGEITIPVNTAFFRATVVPAKGTFSTAVPVTSSTQIIGYGDEDTAPLKVHILNGSNKRVKTLEDDGSGARFATFQAPVASAKIQMVNSTSKRLMYSWATVVAN